MRSPPNDGLVMIRVRISWTTANIVGGVILAVVVLLLLVWGFRVTLRR